MTKTIKALFTILVTAIALPFMQSGYADTSNEEKLDFATSLEETLGHFWALELNLDEGNSELALVHATHPISELYDSMKPTLTEADSEFDATVQTTLMELGEKTGEDVSRNEAQNAIDKAKEIVEQARIMVVGEELSNNPDFKMKLMIDLLETSIVEYEEAVSDGIIEEMAEFQDGSAFVWRSQQIFDTIKNDIDEHEAHEIEEFYEDLWDAYDVRADPENVETFANGIIHELEEVIGIEHEIEELGDYVENIRHLLTEADEEYAEGNLDEALSLATKAYLDNYEFLESPLKQVDEELMEEVEILMREELRDMIKEGQSTSNISSQISLILDKMNEVAMLVAPEKVMKEEVEENGPASPLKQVNAGISPQNVECKDGMELIFKAVTGDPACVSPEGASKLIDWGWART